MGGAGRPQWLDQVRALALRVTDIALDVGLKPLENVLSNAFAGLGSAATGILPFAKGGVASAPTLFPLGGETGLMGEAGAEAILPLARGPDGRLGVAASRGGSVPDSRYLQCDDAGCGEFSPQSEAQVTAMLARAVGRGRARPEHRRDVLNDERISRGPVSAAHRAWHGGRSGDQDRYHAPVERARKPQRPLALDEAAL